MAQPGETITYSFSGSKVTEDISDIDEITIDRMDGADGGEGDGTYFSAAGGSGGYISGATVDVSSYNTLEIWVGEKRAKTSSPDSTFGRSNGGSGGDLPLGHAGTGGGSTELWTNNNSVFIAAADGGGGGAANGAYRTEAGGGGGGAGGLGAAVADDDGSDAQSNDCGGARTGCAGGDGGGVSGSVDPPNDGADGGQELGIADGGTLTTGGSSDGNGEITLSFKEQLAPTAPSNLSLSLQ